MQNKGAIRLVAIALALVSLYQLSFTFVTNSVRKDAVEYAGDNLEKESAYLDSMGSEVVYNFLWIRKYTFRECQERELNLGLDLKGGMNVTLEVSVVELIETLANHSQDSTFQKALRLAKQRQQQSQDDYVTLFGQAFNELDPNARLASVFNTIELKEKINFNSTNEEVLAVIRKETQGAIDNSFNILRTRIDRFGVTQPNIQELEGRSGRILVELPGVKDPERVRKLLQGTANLEFWETYDVKDIWNNIQEANNKLKELNNANESLLSDNDTSIVSDTTTNLLETQDTTQTSLLADNTDSTNTEESLLNQLEDDSLKTNNEALTLAQFEKENPLFAVLRPITDNQGQLYGGAAVGYARAQDTAKVNEIFRKKQIKELLPRDLKFLWTVKSPSWDKTETVFELVAIKVTNRDGTAPLAGDVVSNAREEFDEQKGSAEVTMTMNGEGTKIWGRITKENIGNQIAIVLDNYVYSYPVVQNEISTGNTSISGNFTIQEAKDLANVLKSGKLPAPAHIIEENIVGPSLGQEAINSGLSSFIIAFIVVLLYMIFYYNGAGLVANAALIANLFFIFGVLASLSAVLTLPGIAGIVLTIGMSVDANVIIFERIREELRAGKGLKLAIKDGYKNAYSAIIDGNVTTLLTGVILYTFGHGPIQGFATTLVIGIFASLFSAIFITRLIFQAFLDRNKPISFSIKLTENVFKNANFNFLGKRKVFYVISAIIILAGVVSLFTKGLNQSVDFVGGRSYTVSFNKPINTVDVSNTLANEFNSTPEVKTFGSDNQVKITTKYRIDDESPEADKEVEDKLYEGLVKLYNAENITKELFISGFKIADDGSVQRAGANDPDDLVFGRKSSMKVGPTIADDIKVSAIWAILLSLLVMFVYIFIRFKNWQYGLGATAALIHDTLIVLGLFSILNGILPFSLEIDQAFIAAILTVIGYSVNDTVIVFDRIREFLNLHPKRKRDENMNAAMNSTLSRTVNTSVTTFFVLLVIFVFGGEVIRGFVFALMVGIIVGTYSSLFISTPVTYDTMRKIKDVEVKTHKKEYLGGKKKDKKKKQTID